MEDNRPIRPFTAYQGAKTLHIHPIWMLDAVSGGPQPQPWFHNIILVHFGSIFLPHFSNKSPPPPPEQVLQCKGAPICPSTVYESAQTLHIPPIWMLDAVWDLLQPQPWHHNVVYLRYYSATVIQRKCFQCCKIKIFFGGHFLFPPFADTWYFAPRKPKLLAAVSEFWGVNRWHLILKYHFECWSLGEASSRKNENSKFSLSICEYRSLS